MERYVHWWNVKLIKKPIEYGLMDFYGWEWKLFDILNLFSHLLNQYFQLNGRSGDFGIDGF